jgi:hypothetical protein
MAWRVVVFVLLVGLAWTVPELLGMDEWIGLVLGAVVAGGLLFYHQCCKSDSASVMLTKAFPGGPPTIACSDVAVFGVVGLRLYRDAVARQRDPKSRLR